MGIEKLIVLGATLVFLAVATGNLPGTIRLIQSMQLILIMESQASKWPSAILLPITN
jgi:hypothetical protein